MKIDINPLDSDEKTRTKTIPAGSDGYAIGKAIADLLKDKIYGNEIGEYEVIKDGRHMTSFKFVKKPGGILVIESE